MNRIVFLFAVTLLLLGCLSGERMVVQQSSGASTNAAANAIAGSGSGDGAADSKAYWGAASPISILAWKYSGNSLELMVQNKDAQKITITSLSIDGDSALQSKISLETNQAKTITLSLGKSCGSAGDSFELGNILIMYDKAGLSGFTQKGGKPIVGTCS
jgi:hypothetical protein